MNKPFAALILLFGVISNLTAHENHFAGARSIALSNAFISVSDPWSTFHNQAGLTGINNISAGIYYESRFLVDELSFAAGSFTLPTSHGSFSASTYQFGKGAYKEHKLGLAYSKALSNRLSAGIQFDYLSSRLPENSRAFGFVTFEAGFIYNYNRKLFFGGHVFNPVGAGAKTNVGKQTSPMQFRVGGHYNFDEQVLIIVETQKSPNRPYLVKTGVEFWPVENLAFRIGVSGKPTNYTSGIGYTFNKLTTDIGFSYHGNLGITPSISLQIKL